MENFVPSESEALRNLHQLAHAAMFEETTWPANPARCDAIERMLINSGLLSEATRTYVDPRLIPEVEFLLFCIGTPDPDYILCFLVEYGHATEEEALEVTGAAAAAESANDVGSSEATRSSASVMTIRNGPCRSAGALASATRLKGRAE